MMGLVDVAIVGRLGTEPLAAVGLCTVVYNFSNFIWNFLLYTTTPRWAPLCGVCACVRWWWCDWVDGGGSGCQQPRVLRFVSL